MKRLNRLLNTVSSFNCRPLYNHSKHIHQAPDAGRMINSICVVMCKLSIVVTIQAPTCRKIGGSSTLSAKGTMIEAPMEVGSGRDQEGLTPSPC